MQAQSSVAGGAGVELKRKVRDSREIRGPKV